jgi:LmbE family N-acetylglucosaminyl deacetylase
MAAGSGPLAGRSLLAVFAHPDDESIACGGLLARCARLGARVALLCLTRGEHGPDATGIASTPAMLGEVRSRELRAAADQLGVATLVVRDYEDGMLPWVDQAALETDIRRVIRRLGPDVVVTFGDDGLYGHPDHVTVHERTAAAVAAMRDEAPALYFVTIPPGAIRTIVQHAEEVGSSSGRPGSPRHVLGIADPDAFGALAAPPSLVVDVSGTAARKLAAIRCHRTQLADDSLMLVGECDAGRLLGVEHFHRAEVGARGETFLDRLPPV